MEPLLQVADEAHLAGTLTIESALGFMPMLGAEFEILTATGGVHEEFDDVLLPSLLPGLSWELTYNATSILLKIVESVNPGDYNLDGIVDAADYVVWRKNDGTQTGYDNWRANFGQTAGSGSDVSATTTVPEPATLMLLMFAAAGWFLRRGPAV
jgi:hypothetical protein